MRVQATRDATSNRCKDVPLEMPQSLQRDASEMHQQTAGARYHFRCHKKSLERDATTDTTSNRWSELPQATAGAICNFACDPHKASHGDAMKQTSMLACTDLCDPTAHTGQTTYVKCLCDRINLEARVLPSWEAWAEPPCCEASGGIVSVPASPLARIRKKYRTQLAWTRRAEC